MSFNTEKRGFAVGQEIGGCGRCTRVVLGLLLLVSIGTSIAQSGLSADSRRLAPDRGSVRCPLLAVWREDAPSLAPHSNFLAPRRVHPVPFSHPLGLGVRGSAVPVRVPDRRGALVLWRLRGGGVAQPPLPPTLHGLLPAQCHRPGRAPLHATVNDSQDQGSQCSTPSVHARLIGPDSSLDCLSRFCTPCKLFVLDKEASRQA